MTFDFADKTLRRYNTKRAPLYTSFYILSWKYIVSLNIN